MKFQNRTTRSVVASISTLIAWLTKYGTLRSIGYSGYLTFHTISFLTTASGIAAVVNAHLMAGRLVPSLVVAGLLSAAVQAMVGVFGHRFREASRRRERTATVASLTIVVICGSVSVGFAYSFWWELFRGDAVAAEVAVAENDRIVAPVEAFDHQVRTASSSLDRLAAYSAERAATELRVGGTCEAVGQGAGPRTRLRKTDARVFRALADEMARTSAGTRAALGELQDLRSIYDPATHDQYTHKVNQILQRLRPVLADRQQRVIAQLLARIQRGRGEMEDDLTGERFRCRDSQLEAFLEQAVKPLERVQEIGDDVPKELRFHRPGRRSALAVAYGQLGGLIGFSGAAGSDFSSPEPADVAPLVLAAIVDVVLFIFPFGLDLRGGGTGPRPGDANRAAGSFPMPPGVAMGDLRQLAYGPSPSADLYALFERFTVRASNHDLVLLPVSRRSRKSKKAELVLDAVGARPTARSVPMTTRLRAATKQLPTAFGDRVTVYRLKKGFLADLALHRVRPASRIDSDADAQGNDDVALAVAS